MKQTDILSSIQLTGTQSEHIPEIMNFFRARSRLNSADGTPDEVDRRAVRFLERLVRKAAVNSMQQLLSGTLEWRRKTARRTRSGPGWN